MNILEQLYETNFTKINFLERKISIKNDKTILKGPPKSGKSYLIYDYLSNFEQNSYIYIDFDDYKNEIEDIQRELNSFIKKNNIEVVVFENYKFDLELPKVTNIVISTKEDKKLEGFETLFISPLDFEEFLLFDSKHQNISQSFNSFLKFGNFPEIVEYPESKKIKRNYEICKLFSKDTTEFEILFILLKNAGEKKSLFQLYNSLKKRIKISKDRFYKTCEVYEKNNLIYFCEKFTQPKALKKLFVFNHSLPDIVSYKKNFNNLFKNMVFLELKKRDKEVFYFDEIDFYIPKDNLVIMVIPFFNNIISSSIISKILPFVEKNKIKNITVVTVNGEQDIFIGEIEANILPFYRWVFTL